ncbi:MAG: HEAT repeat domain-containing protein [Candidatus Odinarchaeota archaeon]
MSKDLKDLIDTVEKDSKTQAELEQIIQSLKEEKNRLEFTVNEQKLLIENLKSQMKHEEIEQAELPSEIDVLKDIILSQRKELEEKDNLIYKLNDKLLITNTRHENSESFDSKENLNEEFINAQKLIVQLTDENEQYRNEITQLQQKVDEIQAYGQIVDEHLDEIVKLRENEELTNFKKLNFQLMQENGLLRVEIESLKAKLQTKINELNSEELEKAYDTIEDLKAELVEYKVKIKELQERIKDFNEPVTISTEEALEFAKLREEYDNLKSELLKHQEENKNLNERIIELKKETENLENIKVYSTSVSHGMPKKIRNTLFNRMYHLLDEENKNKVIDFLIQDLKSKNSQTKRIAIKILSQIKHNKIYDAFVEIINDKDWLVRYSLIKALKQYENKVDEFKVLLKKFSKDTDVDVRELAVKILHNSSE